MNKFNHKTIVYFLIIVFFSCSSALQQNAIYDYDYKFEKYEPYLSVDSVYKSKEEKLKFEMLKDKFLSLIFDSVKSNLVIDTSNCFFKQGDYVIRKYYVENILHNEGFDTLVVLFIMDWAFYDENGEVRKYKNKEMSQITSTPIRIVINENGSWSFVCKPIIYGNDGTPSSPKMLEKVKLSMKRTIIRCSYFRKDLSEDPTFWYRMFTNPNIFIPDPLKDGFPLN
ncbi:MAG: hypothetical protein V4643_15100 [Bacteroidota bacterium]